MTPQERELHFLNEKVERLEREASERDRRLVRAERRVVHAANLALYSIGGVIWAAIAYLVFWRHNDFWEWVGIAVGVVLAYFVLREIIREFDKD